MRKEAEESSLTPVMRQYRSVKERYPDAILLFRMGDFYEMFYEDALTASKVLGIALTSREKGKENPVPMAGVPHHSVTAYLRKLLDAGYRAAICEQLEEPSKDKPIVARDVVRIITPGANIETDLLEARESNFLLAVTGEENDGAEFRFGIALADISTGQMMAAEIEDRPTLASEIVRFDPREVLLPPGSRDLEVFLRDKLPRAALTHSKYFMDFMDWSSALQRIDALMGADGGTSCAGLLTPLPATACAALLEYLSSTQPGRPLPIKRVAVYRPCAHMILDEMTVRHLELTASSTGGRKGSLLSLIDRTETSMGSRLLRSWLLAPLMDIAAIRRRQDGVEYFLESYRVRREVRSILAEVCDIERIISRCIVRAASPKELGALRDTLLVVPDLLRQLCASGFMEGREGDAGIFGQLPDVPEKLSQLLAGALVQSPPPNTREGGIFKNGFDEELDRLIFLSTSSKEAIAALEAREKEATRIGTLKVKYNKVFGYFIEVTKSHLNLVPQERYTRKQTIAGGERYVTEELKDLESKIITADEKRKALEQDLFLRLVQEVASAADELRSLADFLAALDAASALAELAASSGWTRPVVEEGGVIYIKEGRHPVVEATGAPEGFVPNDVRLDLDGECIWVLTGPNMSGKSTFMRQVALCVILAQMGSFIPASEARIGVCDRIFTRVGASDNLAWGQSTFMVEMMETASILKHATRRSLVVLDEIGRGTSTFDGMSIAWAVGEYLHERVGCRTLLATHYHELTALTSLYPRIANYNVIATELGDRIIFLRKVQKGGSSRSYGIQVARLAGVPAEVIARAKDILRRMESGEGAWAGPRVPGAAPVAQAGEVRREQLSLFASSPDEKKYMEMRKVLNALEIEKMTPLEAMNLLARLKALA